MYRVSTRLCIKTKTVYFSDLSQSMGLIIGTKEETTCSPIKCIVKNNNKETAFSWKINIQLGCTMILFLQDMLVNE